MKSFIRVIEYWVPSEDGSLLEFGGGLFGAAHRFAAISQNLCFGRGEGLPGRAWDTGHPIVLKELEGSYFRRAKAARAAGLTCGIAVPIFKGDRLSSVAVIFCGDDEQHAGAIELWGNDPEESHDMTLVDGYYGTTGDTFEFISRATAFRRGTGLPGMAWEAQKPVFMPDLGKGSGFLRAEGAVKVGINRGFAIPCSTLNGQHFVMAFLSALATPVARRVETWEPDADGTRLRRSLGFSEASAAIEVPETIALAVDAPGTPGAIARAFSSGIPAVAEPMIAIPVAPGGRITAVMALHF
ncbi:GAF domain-containing protein [Variovorax sp. J22R133]|uniref:GAF domain-containing protein n=1 Tax=Variovorax brevis TaxID=3053503 RepID=UPI0025752370|nr:GAF domain-containing protein [Variovorax sp. J22R133]MDM0113306.1 GAF domain-containing protein [Variovorax sp. J22R133]